MQIVKAVILTARKCKTPFVPCIELCCGLEQGYEEETTWCYDLPNFVKPLWLGMIESYMKTQEVEFAEFGECSLSFNQSVIAKCYAPEYDYNARYMKLIEYSNVPCERLQPQFPDPLGWLLLRLSIIFLPIMLLFTCLKKDKKNHLSYKLISWYLTMTVATLLVGQLGIYIQGKIKSQDSLWNTTWNTSLKFFWASTSLWLSCIGYNAYVQFKEANVPHRQLKDRMRFIWYSIFVWAGALTLCIVDEILLRWLKFYHVTGPLLHLIGYFNVFAFLVLSLKICIIRCGVIGISSEKHIKCKLAFIVCRLFILMGIPRMLLMILTPFIASRHYVVIIHFEPYLVYGTFILENENFSTLFPCKWWCCSSSKNEDNERTTEDITMRNTSAV